MFMKVVHIAVCFKIQNTPPPSSNGCADAILHLNSMNAKRVVFSAMAYKAEERDKEIRLSTMGILSEKCVVRRFRRCANIIECTYTKLDSVAYYTTRLYDIAYCC